jgi:hypothetical protein
MAHLGRLCISARPLIGVDSSRALFQPVFQASYATASKSSAKSQNAQKYAKKSETTTKKRKVRTSYIQYDLKDAEQLSLCDAMRYVQSAPFP